MWISRVRWIAVWMRWIMIHRSIVRIIVRSWWAILFICRINRLCFVNSRLIWRVNVDSAGWWNLTRSRVCWIVFIDSCGVVWWRFLDWQGLEAGVRGRCVWVVAPTLYVSFRFIKHGSIFRWITIWICTVWFRNFVSIRPDSCCHFCLRFWKNFFRQLNIAKCAWACWVFNTNDLIVIGTFRNRHHLIVNCSRLRDVPFRGVCGRRGRDGARSWFSDIVLTVVDWRRGNRTTRLAVQSIIIIWNIALRCCFNCSCLVGRTLVIHRAIDRWCIRRVENELTRNRIFVRVSCCCFDDLRARFAICATRNKNCSKLKILFCSSDPCVLSTRIYC